MGTCMSTAGPVQTEEQTAAATGFGVCWFCFGGVFAGTHRCCFAFGGCCGIMFYCQ